LEKKKRRGLKKKNKESNERERKRNERNRKEKKRGIERKKRKERNRKKMRRFFHFARLEVDLELVVCCLLFVAKARISTEIPQHKRS